MKLTPVILGSTLLALSLALPASADRRFQATLTGGQQVPVVSTTATGIGTVVLNTAETQITVNLTFAGLSSNVNAAHIHGPGATGSNVGVLFDFTGVTPAATSGTIPQQTFAITAAQVTQLKAGQFYFNIHTGNFGGGEIRGQILTAPPLRYRANLTGSQQAPPVVSTATGTGTVSLNATEDQIMVDLTFAGLSSNVNAAHIHTGAAGVNGGVTFDFSAATPAATSGTIPTQTFAISSSQVTTLKAGNMYFNIHTANNGGGEIRGQIGVAPRISFGATLNGAQESPHTASSGTGSGVVLLNAAKDQITVNLSYASLSSNASGAHIHGPAAPGANGGILFDLSSGMAFAQTGSITEKTFSITPSQVAQLESGQLYFNVHTTGHSGGEIRGQITASPVRKFAAVYVESQVVPPTGSPASCNCTLTLNDAQNEIEASGPFGNLGSMPTSAHVHGPAAVGTTGPVVGSKEGFTPAAAEGIIANQTFGVTASQVSSLLQGLVYGDMHSTNFPDGEIRGQYFATPQLKVSKGGTGSSSNPITSSPAGIDCGGDCTESYLNGTIVTLTAGAASAGSFFSGWFGGGCSGTGTCVHTISTATEIIAVYTSLSTTVEFTDDPLSAGTLVKAAHILELRSAIDALRSSNGLGTFDYNDASLAAGDVVKAAHVHDLRSALSGVYVARGRALPGYPEPNLSGAAIKALHVSEVRQAYRMIE